MCILLIPNNGSQAEDFFGNGSDAVVRVSVRGSPKLGNSATGRVVDEFYCPAELA